MKSLKLILMFSAFLVGGTVEALDREPLQLSAAGDMPSQRELIEAKLAQPEYVELGRDDRAALDRHLASLESNPGDIQAIEHINVILKKAFSDSKLVCTFDTPLGSNRKMRSCMTVAAKKRSYLNTQRGRELSATSSFSSD